MNTQPNPTLRIAIIGGRAAGYFAAIEAKRWGELGKKGIGRLVETLTNDLHTISGKGRFRDEFVTCGGVSLSSINMNTLESRICPHLFFAGEVLDVDAITGGFNLQAAWSMGYVVGQNIVR